MFIQLQTREKMKNEIFTGEIPYMSYRYSCMLVRYTPIFLPLKTHFIKLRYDFCHLVIDLNLLSITFLNGVLFHVFPTINCTCSVEMRSCRNPKHLIFFKHPLLSGRILGYIVNFRLP